MDWLSLTHGGFVVLFHLYFYSVLYDKKGNERVYSVFR